MREKLFTRLNEYKKVVSPGRYLNNIGENGVSWREKYDYLMKSKFTIASDSIHYPGFVTEKIIQPFQYHSIPIYFGSTTIDTDLNPEAFVWCKDEKDLDRTVEQVIFLDTHDEAYLKMLKACPLHSQDALVQKYLELENWLVSVFNQPKDSAGRRIRMFCADLHESYLKNYMNIASKTKLSEKLYKIKKRIAKLLRLSK